jgi:hypothetical protein
LQGFSGVSLLPEVNQHQNAVAPPLMLATQPVQQLWVIAFQDFCSRLPEASKFKERIDTIRARRIEMTPFTHQPMVIDVFFNPELRNLFQRQTRWRLYFATQLAELPDHAFVIKNDSGLRQGSPCFVNEQTAFTGPCLGLVLRMFFVNWPALARKVTQDATHSCPLEQRFYHFPSLLPWAALALH